MSTPDEELESSAETVEVAAERVAKALVMLASTLLLPTTPVSAAEVQSLRRARERLLEAAAALKIVTDAHAVDEVTRGI